MAENSTKQINSVSVEELYNEIREIYCQYKLEVPNGRRTWPVSIKSRILELWKLGVSTNEIASKTELPAQTMYSWRQNRKKANETFLPIPIIKKRHHKLSLQLSQLESKTNLMHKPDPTITVTVIISDQIRLEKVPIQSAVMVAREFLKK